MKRKLLEALKTRYVQLGLGDEQLGQIAEVLSATGLVTEDNLSSIVEAQEEALKSKQKEQDKLRSRIKSLEGQLEEFQKGEEQNKKEKERKHEEEMPEWFKAYQSQLEEKLQSLTQEQERENQARATADLLRRVNEQALKIGIPQWRIDEGFVGITAETSEEEVNKVLAQVKKNISLAKLSPEQNQLTATQEDALLADSKDWAKTL